MNIDWEIIREKIKNNVEEILTTGDPNYSAGQIKNGIELLFKFIAHPVEENSLKGLPKAIFPALQEAFIDKKGDMGPLRALADSFEPFLKKYAIVVLGHRPAAVVGKTLLPLLKLIELNQELTTQGENQYPNLAADKLHTFRDKKEYLYQICNAYLVRNEVHNSPSWGEAKVYSNLTDILVVMLFAILKNVAVVENLPKQEFNSIVSEQLNSEENKILYDFISFGNTATELKTQVVNAFILHELYSKGKATATELKSNCDAYFGSTLSKNFFDRRLEKLREQRKIIKSEVLYYILTSDEAERLKVVYNEFLENRDLFLLYYKELLESYGAILHFDALLEKLYDFFIKNFNIDVSEAYDDGNDIPKEDQLYDDLISYIYQIISPEDLGKQFFKELLKLCEDSDFIVRVSASKVLGKLTNPENFEAYIRARHRTVYLDTQIVLHILCTGYLRNPGYENTFYQIAEELVAFDKDNKQVKFKFAKPYLLEVAHQLRLALMLIPYEDFVKSEFSTNVFYQFYNFLKKSNQLDEDDDSFEKFLNHWLYIREDDAYEIDSTQILLSSLKNVLTDQYNIEVEILPPADNRESAITVLESVLRQTTHSPKAPNVLLNDAWMVCHLSNRKLHSDEPFFLTWDKTFTAFRKAFKGRFYRNEPILWHLFSPAKFLNHMSLISFKIDPKSLTHEYLSILDSLDLHEKTRTLFDSLNKLTDIKNISKEKRRRYVQYTVEIFDSNEFSADSNVSENEMRGAIAKPFEQMLDEINKYYHTQGRKYTIEHYRKMLLEEPYFIRFAQILRDEIRNSMAHGKKITEEYFDKINSLLEEFIDGKPI
ncbi:hypothetical protein [Mucilaginibacter aquariorum]|uniref:DUF4209 domain-containing protein n=1 Tax=Mucilaginibacter aquariorum TaxID=2967225 RepID=A0ABT1SZA3_9SPHI|nr:hypothetical protein [Mucilaginibacter aquariorum]MCQ6957675.1 hypothetical protein [Mucilaginibacter aquariorum]